MARRGHYGAEKRQKELKKKKKREEKLERKQAKKQDGSPDPAEANGEELTETAGDSVIPGAETSEEEK